MQPQMNPESLPKPVVVPEPTGPRRPRRRKLWIPAALLAIAGAGYFLLSQRLAPQLQTGGPAIVGVRTATAAVGNLERTLRLTGSTTAEKYVSIVAPQLRGGRGGGVQVMQGGRGMTVMVSSGGGGGGGGGGGSSRSSSTGSQSASASSSVSSAIGSISGTGASGGSTGGTSSASMRGGSSNRFGGSRGSTGGGGGASTATAAASTAAAAASSGGGGSSASAAAESMLSGGASDFMQVLQKTAKPGSRVQKGDIVAEFDRQYQELRLDDYRSTVEQGERNLRKMDSELEVTRKAHQLSIDQARAAVDKAKLDIKTIPVRSQIETELLNLQLEEAEARLKQLLSEVEHQRASEASQRRNTELDLAQSRQELRRAERNVERMLMSAPMDGMVVMQNVFRGGEFVQIREGDQLFPGQMFMQIVDPSSMLVSASINQADVELLRVGARAHLHFDAYPGLALPGRVIAIGAMTRPGGQRGSYVKQVPVFLKIERMDPRIIPDMSVSVDVILDAVENQVVAPLESVFRDAPQAAPYVYVRTARGFEKREVQLGLNNHIKAAILSGLKEGEVVALERPSPGPAKSRDADSPPGVKNV